MSNKESVKIIVRETLNRDVDDIVALFTENGSNPYDWSRDKWCHYYQNYPEGFPISIVAEINGNIVGHYGMLPVTIGGYSAMLGLHAYVANQYRGLTVISALMKDIDARCADMNIDFICGFANKDFALIKKTFFKWKIPFWLSFGRNIEHPKTNTRRKFQFKYSQKWYSWRFGENNNCYISKYKDTSGLIRKQFLKAQPGAILDIDALKGCEAWDTKSHFPFDQKNQFCQPFSLKVYNKKLIEENILSEKNWLIDMGDSDTFQYTPWKTNDD